MLQLLCTGERLYSVAELLFPQSSFPISFYHLALPRSKEGTLATEGTLCSHEYVSASCWKTILSVRCTCCRRWERVACPRVRQAGQAVERTAAPKQGPQTKASGGTWQFDPLTSCAVCIVEHHELQDAEWGRLGLCQCGDGTPPTEWVEPTLRRP